VPPPRLAELSRSAFWRVYRAVEEGRAVDDPSLAPAAAQYAAARAQSMAARPAVRAAFVVVLVLVLVRVATSVRDGAVISAAIGVVLALGLIAAFAYGPLTSPKRLLRAEAANRELAERRRGR
jgi:hypothetical protein